MNAAARPGASAHQRRWVGIGLILALATSAAAGQSSTPLAPPACTAPEYRQFDFWLGDWDVYNPAGRLVGHNTITAEFAGCVRRERYSTPRGYVGESFNTWDAARKVWHQSWVDNTGTLLLLSGRFDGRQMVLEGEVPQASGKLLRNRITWTPLPDGSVRQLWETRTDPRVDWAVSFDGRYLRKGSAPPAPVAAASAAQPASSAGP